MTQVTFQDRLKFNAFCSHVANPSRRVMELMSRQPMLVRTESNKIWRAVDFSPRYHQVRLSSVKMDFSRCRCLHKRAESAKREAVNRARLEELMRERKKREEYITWKTSVELGKFYAKFPPLVPRDEREANQRAKTCRLYVTYPYKNPKPFDHRGVGQQGRTIVAVLSSNIFTDSEHACLSFVSAHRKVSCISNYTCGCMITD